MEREGNTTESTAPTEQPQAPDSNVASNTDQTADTVSTPAVSPEASIDAQPKTAPVFQPASQEAASQSASGRPLVVSQPIQPVAQTAQPSEQKPRLNLLRKISVIPKRHVAIVASIATVAILVIIGTVIIANLPSNDTVNNTESETVIIEENTANDESPQNTEVITQVNQLGSADIDSMIKFIDDVVVAHNNGTSYQELTAKNIGNIYTQGIMNIYESAHKGLPGLSNDEKVLRQYIEAEENLGKKYGGTILRFAHAAEDLLQTADSAVEVYNAEMSYGSQDTAKQYKEIAIERGLSVWETDNEGEQ